VETGEGTVTLNPTDAAAFIALGEWMEEEVAPRMIEIGEMKIGDDGISTHCSSTMNHLMNFTTAVTVAFGDVKRQLEAEQEARAR